MVHTCKPTLYRGEQVCLQCGEVLDKVYQDSMMILDHDDKTATQYGAIGRQLTKVGTMGSHIYPGPDMPQYRKMAYLQERASEQTHRRTLSVFQLIASNLQLPNIIRERAAHLYWQYADGKFYNHVRLIALCLLKAIREYPDKTAVTFLETINAFRDLGHRVTPQNIMTLANQLGIE